MSEKMVTGDGVASSTFELPHQLDSARTGGKSGRAHGKYCSLSLSYLRSKEVVSVPFVSKFHHVVHFTNDMPDVPLSPFYFSLSHLTVGRSARL